MYRVLWGASALTLWARGALEPRRWGELCRFDRSRGRVAPALAAKYQGARTPGSGVSENDAADLSAAVEVPTDRLRGQPAPPHAITTTEKGNVTGRRRPEGP